MIYCSRWHLPGWEKSFFQISVWLLVLQSWSKVAPASVALCFSYHWVLWVQNVFPFISFSAWNAALGDLLQAQHPPLQLVTWCLSSDEGLWVYQMGSSCVPGSKPAPVFGEVMLFPGVCRSTAISIRADLCTFWSQIWNRCPFHCSDLGRQLTEWRLNHSPYSIKLSDGKSEESACVSNSTLCNAHL